MTRNLGLTVFVSALLAMSAIGPSVAQANSSLDVGFSPAWIEGEQVVQNKFIITGAKKETLSTVKCASSSFSATTTTNNVIDLKAKPFFGAIGTCEMGGLVASVKVNLCSFTLTDTVNAGEFVAEVTCEMGTVIEIVQGACVVTIAPQAGLEEIKFADVAGSNPAHILATLAVKKIALGIGAGCPMNLRLFATTGDLTGTQTVKAFKDENGLPTAQTTLFAT